MATYILKSANSDLAGGADFNKVLSAGTETSSTLGVTVASGATEDSFGFTIAENPDTDGATGNYTAELRIAALQGNANISGSVAVARVNSAGVQQAISAFSAEQVLAAAMATTFTFTLTAADLGTWATGDRLKVVHRFRETLGVGAQSLTLTIGTADSEVVAPWTLSPRFASGSAVDADRDFVTPFQDVTINFDQAVQDTGLSVGDVASGHTIKVNGSAQATTYRSGSGTSAWKLRVPSVVKNGDTITWSYSRSTGTTVSVSTGQEQIDATDKSVTNSLTKRVRFTLKNSSDDLVASQAVKLAVFQFDSGTVANANWMSREQKSTPTTSAAGVIDVQYTGSAAVDGAVYVAVVRPNATPTESMIWTETVT